MNTDPTQGSWSSVNWHEVVATMATSAAIGLIRLGYLIQRGRQFRAFDMLVDPAMAVLGGMIAWAIAEYANTPDLVQAVGTSLASWAGPRFLNVMEVRYLSALRTGNTVPADLDSKE